MRPTPDAPHATLVLTNGKVVTLNARAEVAQAVAIRDERIVAVGSAGDIGAFVGPDTQVVDLGGRTAIPGLIDAHAHMDREGLKQALPSMAGVRGIDDILQRIEALVARARPGEWIVTMPLGDPPEFEGLPEGLKEKRFPTRADLDRVAPDNPVYIKSAWGYWRVTMPLVSIANSRALAAAGVTRATEPPCDSVKIDRDSSGEPTGVFREWNRMPVVELTLMAAAPAFDLATRTQALPPSMRIYNSFGTTSVFEGHGVAGDVIEAYQRVHEACRQTVRATLAFSPAWRTGDVAEVRDLIKSWGRWLGRKGLGDDWLRMQGLYSEADVSPEHRLRAGAFPRTGWAGFNFTGLPLDVVKVLLRECALNGIRVNGINPEMLDLFAEAAKAASIADQRWVLAHISTLTQQQIELIRDLGIVVTAHTNGYIWKSGAALLDRVGRERENDVVPLRRLLDAGVPVALGTDNVPVSLWYPIWQTVARIDRTIDAPIAPAQALTREKALRCATAGGAYLTFEEDRKGSIEPGKLADIVVPSQDPLTCDLARLRDTVADLVIVGGKIVFERTAQVARPQG